MKPDTQEMLGNLFKVMQKATTRKLLGRKGVVCISAGWGGGACRSSMHWINYSLGKRVFFYPCCHSLLILAFDTGTFDQGVMKCHPRKQHPRSICTAWKAQMEMLLEGCWAARRCSSPEGLLLCLPPPWFMSFWVSTRNGSPLTSTICREKWALPEHHTFPAVDADCKPDWDVSWRCF